MDYHEKINNALVDLKYPDEVSNTHTNAFSIDSSSTSYDDQHNCVQIQTAVKVLGAKPEDELLNVQLSIPSIGDYITKFKLDNSASRVEFVVNGTSLNTIYDAKADTWYNIYPIPVNNLVVPYGRRFLNIEGNVNRADIIYLLGNSEVQEQSRVLGAKYQ